MYLTFAEYRIYGGSLDDEIGAAFDMWEADARYEIDNYTMGRLRGLDSADISVAVKRCMAKLIDLLEGVQAVTERGNRHVVSESNDGVSRTYSQPSSSETQAAIGQIIYRYLRYEVDQHGTPLLYRGVNML